MKSKKTPDEQMKDLGKRLGESCISADLATLLSFKARHEREKESKKVRPVSTPPTRDVQQLKRTASWLNMPLHRSNSRFNLLSQVRPDAKKAEVDFAVVMQLQIFRLLGMRQSEVGNLFFSFASNYSHTVGTICGEAIEPCASSESGFSAAR